MTSELLKEMQDRIAQAGTDEQARLHVATAMMRAGLVTLLQMNMRPDNEQALRYIEQYDSHTVHFMTRVRKETGLTKERERVLKEIAAAQRQGLPDAIVLGGEGG